MNIFFLDRDLKKCVSYYVKSHVTKMPLEYCQLLSTALRISDEIIVDAKCELTGKHGKIKLLEGENYIYNPESERFEVTLKLALNATHINHPCSIWVRESLSHWLWLKDLSKALGDEFIYRRQKFHSSAAVAQSLRVPKKMKDLGWLRDPPQAMPDEYKCDDVITAYRNYYIGEKARLADWETRPVPDWWIAR